MANFLGNIYDALAGKSAVPSTSITPTAATQNVRYDASTNTFFDPTTGQRFTMPPGAVYDPATGGIRTQDGRQIDAQSAANAGGQITNPSVLQQVASASTISQNQLSSAAGFQGNAQQVFGQEQNLAQNLNNVINNPTAPSVAQTQLQQALGQSQAAQLSAAAGVSGSGAALAREDAMRNMAMQQNAAAGQATLARAQEIAQARQGLAQLLNQAAGQSLQGYGTSLGAGENFSNQALQGQMGIENMSNTGNQTNAANKQKLFDPAAGGAVQGAGSYFGGSGSGAEAAAAA